ncbi:MAG: tRNA lysidine(34) synthetase TilS [Sphingomonadales bacterium]
MQTPNAPPDTAVARFRADWLTLTDGDGGRIGVAVSGGADSLALMLLAAAAFPGAVIAATVDHGLRTEAAEEARQVDTLAERIGVPHRILTLDLAAGGNVSARARTARYVALETWRQSVGAGWIATGHHADDQLETMVMRLNRSSGVGGLAGIRRRNGVIVRPLLGWRRAELDAIVQGAGLTPVDDPTNRDDRYDRARLRKLLANADWFDAAAVTRSANRLADADSALDWVARTIKPTAATMADLPDELARRVLLRAIRTVDPALDPRGDALSRTLAELRQGRKTMLGNVMCLPGAQWRFEASPDRCTEHPVES